MLPDLRVQIAGIEFANPVMTASGCAGYGEELAELYPLSKLGALVTKSITRKPRWGHKPPRTVETPGGMLNAIGLANVGIDDFLKSKVPFLERQKTKVIVNVAGSTIEEYVYVCERLADCERVDMVELNISCPNVDEGGIEFGSNIVMTEKSVSEVRKVFKRPIIAKLAPNVTSVADIAKAAERGGADAFSIINSVIGTSININTWKPLLSNITGGLTGPAIKPIALAMVRDVYRKSKLPIVGIGGITDYKDVVEFMLCGATAIQVGTQLFIDPTAPVKIVDGLKKYLKSKNFKSVNELIGKAHNS